MPKVRRMSSLGSTGRVLFTVRCQPGSSRHDWAGPDTSRSTERADSVIGAVGKSNALVLHQNCAPLLRGDAGGTCGGPGTHCVWIRTFGGKKWNEMRKCWRLMFLGGKRRQTVWFTSHCAIKAFAKQNNNKIHLIYLFFHIQPPFFLILFKNNKNSDKQDPEDDLTFEH